MKTSAIALTLAMAVIAVRAQPPTLSDVLDRAASYVAAFERQLTGIAADEIYVQSMGIPGRHGELIPTTQRTLTATLLLIREGDEGYLEARDVREVDGVTVRDRAGSLAARAALEAPLWGVVDKMRLRSENARYNIGDIVRTINTPLLALQVLRRKNQSRFSFSPSTERAASVRAAADGDTPGVFRVSTDVWVIGFRERARGTLIRTETGRDVPCRGRLWIDAASGRVMMTEMVVSGRVEAQVTVSFKSEPLLGLLPPIEMHEHYRASGRSQTIVEASASYGPFHLISQTRP